jgi:hypothetical protein
MMNLKKKKNPHRPLGGTAFYQLTYAVALFINILRKSSLIQRQESGKDHKEKSKETLQYNIITKKKL